MMDSIIKNENNIKLILRYIEDESIILRETYILPLDTDIDSFINEKNGQ